VIILNQSYVDESLTGQWLRANGCDWNTETCSAAAGGGHLEVLEWARENGCLEP
jgi:hypothetical protein